MMDCFYRLMANCPVWIDTQTWSYKAVGIYMDMGFIPMKTATFSEVPNEYNEALRVMKGKMREDKYKQYSRDCMQNGYFNKKRFQGFGFDIKNAEN